MQNIFSFQREESLKSIWWVPDVATLRSGEEWDASDIIAASSTSSSSSVSEDNEDHQPPLYPMPIAFKVKKTLLRPARPVFNATIYCATRDGTGIRIHTRTPRTLELDIYDAPLFYKNLQQAVAKTRQPVDARNRIKTLRRYFEPLCKGGRWCDTTPNISIRLKKHESAYQAYRDVARHFKL